MKFLISLTFMLVFIIAFTTCKKNSEKLRAEELPPITQTGANTFGCLINGNLFLPNGYDGSKPNFHVVADPGSGELLLESYRYIRSNEQRIYFGSNNIYKPGNYPIINLGNTSVGYSYNSCYIIFVDSIYRRGYINILKYDVINRILSGTFEAHIFNPLCGDTIHFTNGRFDKKL